MNQQTYITIFGATGKIGRELIQFLSTVHIPTIAVTRDKTKAISLPLEEWVEALTPPLSVGTYRPLMVVAILVTVTVNVYFLLMSLLSLIFGQNNNDLSFRSCLQVASYV